MAAFGVRDFVQTRYRIRLDSRLAEMETDHGLLLDAARRQTDSQTAVIYVFQAETSVLNGITVRSTVAARVKNLGVTLSHPTSQWIKSLADAVEGKPATELNFEKFPEVLQYQLMRLMVVPLRTRSDLLGLLTLGRLVDAGFDESALEVTQRAGRLLTAMLERDWLQHKLLERNLVERAKGILQERRVLSEEESYLLLRNYSRRRRMPMAHVAQEIIETYVPTGDPPSRQCSV
jgi:hypothetical protein